VRTRNDRVEAALVEVGGSVFVGGLSTFLGVLALLFSTGAIFRTFFVMFMSMVVLGMSHGLMFIPVMLSLTGPINPMRKGPLERNPDASSSHLAASSEFPSENIGLRDGSIGC